MSELNRRRFLTLFGIGLGVSGFVPQLFAETNRLGVRTYRQYPDGGHEFFQHVPVRFIELPIGSVYEPLTNREEVWIKTGKYARRLEPNSFLEIIPDNELMLPIGSAREER